MGPVLAVVLGLWPAVAAAHAAPVQLDPPNRAVLSPGPATLRIGLSQPVELGFSRIEVRQGKSVVSDPGALRLEEGGRVLAQPLSDLSPGAYTVKWRVLAIDGHVTEGSYSFTVTAHIGPGAVAAGAPTAGGSPGTGQAEATARPVLVYGTGAAAGALGVAGVVAGLRRRRR